jgi:DNA-binding transcriptional regulator YhcF (GntR family)
MGRVDLRIDRAGELPLGIQLARRIRSHVDSGGLKPGDRLPSVREAAAAAGVNVNTVRTVYGRLEREGLLRTVHGSGTFVAAPARVAGDDPGERRALREQIAALELELARRPPPPTGADPSGAPSGALLSADQLRDVRDELMGRLHELDAERAELLRRLQELQAAEREERAGSEPHPRREAGTPSLAGARVRWVGT